MDEAERREVFAALEPGLGGRVATLMTHGPRFDWSDIARRSDLVALRADIQTEFAAFGSELRSEMAALGGELRGEMGELRGQIGELRGQIGELSGRLDGLTGACC